MTMKLKEDTAEDCLWAIDMMSNLARYTYTQERFFEPFQYVAGNGTSLHMGMDSAITGLLLISDTEAQTQDSIYGRTEFIQLVGITTSESQAIREDFDNMQRLYELMKKDNPDFVTDMKRTKSYL